MCKFSNVDVGDIVFVIENSFIRGDWNSGVYFSKRFSVSYTVSRVTKTQFTAGNLRFKKDNGFEIGGNNVALRAGDKWLNRYSDKKGLMIACCERKQLEEHERKLLKIRKCASYLSGLNILKCADVDTAVEISKKVKEIEELILKGKTQSTD